MRSALILVTLGLLAAPARAQEQDAGPPTAVDASVPDAAAGEGPVEDAVEEAAEAADEALEPPEPDLPDPLPTSEIGRRIEETFRQMQAVTPRLRRQPETLNVRRTLPNFVGSVTRLSEDPALERLDSLHAASLHDLEQEWSRVRSRLLRWQEQLETRSGALSEERQHVVEARRLWVVTRDAEREEPLPESQLTRIETLLERIDRVLRRLDRRLEEVLGLQGELSDQGIRIARVVARIESAQRLARDRRTHRDHRPLWRGWGRLDAEEAEAPPSLGEVAREHGASLRTFLYVEKKGLAWHAVSFLFFAIVFGLLRVRTRSSLAPSTPPSAHRALRARPLASALVIVLIVAPIVYRYVPVAAVGVSLVALVPAIYLLNRQILPTAHRPILALMVLAALSVPLSLGFTPEWGRRFYILALQAGGLGLCLWLSTKRFRAPLDSTDRGTRRMYGLLRFMALPFAVSLYFLLSGYIERAELWTTGTLWAAEQALGLFLAAELLGALLEHSLRQPWARFFYTVRNKRRKVAALLQLALRWFAVGCFFYLALTSFDLLDPTLEASRLAFRRSFEFGSIELSFGDVLAFLLMLFGTFVTMRIVHVLLEHEILPRFELEQGISSAISLSVSYVLVAIGVVLAFGVAGVGPERLALLGGALGVGIGFGLQNVVSNFVSGLILVAERPIKVGDVIEVDELVGTVQRIGIRSSTVMSLNGAEVIVPNSDLISDKLVNWTLSDARRRLELVVGVGYQHPPAEVMQLLTRIVRSQPGVQHDPAPDVICTAFGDSAIEYTLRAWTPGYLQAIATRSALAARVYSQLAEAGLEIPFPQRDLHLRSVSDGAAQLLRGDGEAEEPS